MDYIMLGVGFLFMVGIGFFVVSEFVLVNFDCVDFEVC